MQIVIYDIDYQQLFSIVCSLVTASSYSHVSIVDNDGKMYDTLFLRGEFAPVEAHSIKSDRLLTVFDLGDVDISSWLDGMMSKEYDRIGLLLWPFSIHQKDKYYCFETVIDLLEYYNLIEGFDKSRVSAKDIYKLLINKNLKGTVSTAKELFPNYSK